MKTINYNWEGIDANGHRISGQEMATNRHQCQQMLQTRGITVLRLKMQLNVSMTINPRVTHKDLLYFLSQLSTLTSSGIHLSSALHLMSTTTKNKTLKNILNHLLQDIQNGSSLSQSLNRYPQYFKKTDTEMIAAGEQSGNLPTVLKQVSESKQRSVHLQSCIKKAMIYPLSVLMISLLVCVGLLLFVVPKFQTLFHNFGAELPALTRFVIIISHLLQHHVILLIGTLLISILSFQQILKRSHALKSWMDQCILKIPLIGTIIKKIVRCRWTQILALTLQSGMALTEALTAANQSLSNHPLKKRLMEIPPQIVAGYSLSKALESTQLFDPTALQMIAIGENSGRLDEMLHQLSQEQQKNIDDLFDHISTLIEPITMIFLASLVGSLIIALYLPIFEIGTIIQGR